MLYGSYVINDVIVVLNVYVVVNVVPVDNNQLNNLADVGIDINNVIHVKYARVSISNPIVSIWCAHTILPINVILCNC